MTQAQKTLVTYVKTSKAMAWLSYKSDETANNPNISYEDFCKAMDKQVENHLRNLPVCNVTKQKASPIWA